MLLPNKIDLFRDFAAGVYLSEAQNPIPSPPPYTLYIYVYTLYSILIHTGKGEGQLFTKLGRKFQHD